VERLVNPQLRWTFEREASTVLSRVGWLGLAVDAFWRLLLADASEWVADGSVDGDAPERSGSEFRHDAVRESVSQFFHAQMVASEYARP
jgi:hypothetical protein